MSMDDLPDYLTPSSHITPQICSCPKINIRITVRDSEVKVRNTHMSVSKVLSSVKPVKFIFMCPNCDRITQLYDDT